MSKRERKGKQRNRERRERRKRRKRLTLNSEEVSLAFRLLTSRQRPEWIPKKLRQLDAGQWMALEHLLVATLWEKQHSSLH